MDYAITINNQTGQAQMTYNRATTLMNNIYLSLKIHRGSFFFNPSFGSRLHLLQRAKNTDLTAQLAAGYCKEALQWMIDTGKAKSVEVYVQRDRTQDLHRLYLLVEVTPANSDQPVEFSIFIEVI
jgi:phage gp46-like protein